MLPLGEGLYPLGYCLAQARGATQPLAPLASCDTSHPTRLQHLGTAAKVGL